MKTKMIVSLQVSAFLLAVAPIFAPPFVHVASTVERP